MAKRRAANVCKAPAADARSSDPDLYVGDEIQGLRKARKMTLAQLALQSGVSVGHLSQIERGISTPSIKASDTRTIAAR